MAQNKTKTKHLFFIFCFLLLLPLLLLLNLSLYPNIPSLSCCFHPLTHVSIQQTHSGCRETTGTVSNPHRKNVPPVKEEEGVNKQPAPPAASISICHKQRKESQRATPAFAFHTTTFVRATMRVTAPPRDDFSQRSWPSIALGMVGNDDHHEKEEEEEEQEGVQETEEELATLFTTEAGLLDALMYRNKNQHGRAGYWKRLQVRPCPSVYVYMYGMLASSHHHTQPHTHPPHAHIIHTHTHAHTYIYSKSSAKSRTSTSLRFFPSYPPSDKISSSLNKSRSNSKDKQQQQPPPSEGKDAPPSGWQSSNVVVG